MLPMRISRCTSLFCDVALSVYREAHILTGYSCLRLTNGCLFLAFSSPMPVNFLVNLSSLSSFLAKRMKPDFPRYRFCSNFGADKHFCLWKPRVVFGAYNGDKRQQRLWFLRGEGISLLNCVRHVKQIDRISSFLRQSAKISVHQLPNSQTRGRLVLQRKAMKI